MIIGAFWLGLLLRSWRQRSDETLHRLSLLLRQAQRQAGELRHLAQGFAESDPHPYGTFVRDLNSRLLAVDEMLQAYYQSYTELRNICGNLKSPPLAEWPRVPFIWQEVLAGIEELDLQVEDLLAALEEAQQIGQRMDGLAWEVACQSQAVLALVQGCLQQVEEMQVAGATGEALRNALESAGQWEETLLAQVPLPYFSPDMEVVRAQAGREDTARVYHLLTNAQPAVEKLAQQSQTWVQQRREMEEILAETGDGWARIEAHLVELESPALFPLRLGSSKERLVQAKNLEASLVTPTASDLDVRRLASRLHAARSILKTQQELGLAAQTMIQQQREMSALSLMPDLRQGEEWLRRAQHVAQALSLTEAANTAGLSTDKWAPANFASADQVQSLASDLAQLNDRQRQWRRQAPETGVNEEELSQTLELLRDLASEYRLLRPRLESVQEQLQKLRSAETEARDSLLRLRGVLQQAQSLTNANALVKKAAGSDLGRWQQEVDVLLRDLDLRTKDTLALKTQRFQLLEQKAGQGAEHWLARLQTDLEQRKQYLQTQLEQVQALVSLDDPLIGEVAKLVQPEPVAIHSKPGSRGSEPETPWQGLARLDQEWQRSLASTDRLADLAGPLLERYHKAAKHRLKAQSLYEEALAALPDHQLPWPPTQQRLSTETSEWQRLELRWSALKGERQRALVLLNSLSDLSEAYYALELKLDRLMQQVHQDQEKASENEKRLAASQKQWRQVLSNHRSNRTLESAMNALLTEVERELEDLKKHYQRGMLPAAQVVRGLHGLRRKLDERALPYDEQYLININGELQRK